MITNLDKSLSSSLLVVVELENPFIFSPVYLLTEELSNSENEMDNRTLCANQVRTEHSITFGRVGR